MNETSDVLGPVGLTMLLVVVGAVVGIAASRLVGWGPAGGIALFISSPLVPNVELIGPLSADDILPLVGVGLIAVAVPRPRLTQSRLVQVALGSVAVATLARVVSTIVNADALGSFIGTMGVAVLRPAFFVAVAVGTALALPEVRRTRVVATGLALVGTFEAVFSLVTYLIPIPGVGNRSLRLFETLAGCDARITGTLGLSPNHIGAVFVVTLPFTISMAIQSRGAGRWSWAGASVLQTVALAFTFTRSSILLAGVGAVILLVHQRQWRLLVAGALATTVLMTLVSTVACLPNAAEPSPDESVEPSATSAPSAPELDGPSLVDRFTDPSDRVALWYTAALMMVDHPVGGVGINRMADVLHTNPERYVDTPFGTTTSSAHNTVLLAGAETGVLGAVGMAVLNIVIGLMALPLLVRGGRPSAIYSAAAIAILGFLAQGMLNNLFTVPATGTLLALMVGAFGAVRFPRHRGLAGDARRSADASGG